MRRIPFFLSLPLLLATACTAGEPDEGFGVYDTTPTPKDMGGGQDQPITCDGPSPLAAPVPNPTPPSQYAHKILPIRGKAVGASLVGAVATSGQANPATVGSGDDFCIEVDLVSGANQIQLYSVGQSGCQGRSSPAYQVKYTPIPAPDMGITKPTNLALGKTITSKPAPDTGSNTYVNDGSLANHARYSFFDNDLPSGTFCNNCAWVKIDLGMGYTVSKYRVRWAPNETKEYGKEYAIYTAKSTPAQDPDCTSNVGWTLAHKETNGITVPKDITVQPSTVRYVVLQMCENDTTSLTGKENFKLAEFEAWGVDPGATTPPTPDRCK